MSSGTPVFGRVRELQLLREALRRADEIGQELILLEGDAGIGKTALLRAFVRMHGGRRRGTRILYLAPPAEGRYEPIHHAALAATNRRRYARLGEGRQAVELDRRMITDWLAAIPIWGSLLSAVAATAEALRRRMKSVSPDTTTDPDIAALLAAARRRPLVLLLDQVELADPVSVARLESLVCVADEGSRILVVAAYRPTAPGVPNPPVHSLTRSLPLQNEAYSHVKLGPLDEEAVEAWVRDALGTDAVGVAAQVIRATGGHPERVAAAIERLRDAEPTAEAGAAETASPIPTEHLYADLQALPAAIAHAVRSASALGERFDALTLAEQLGEPELRVEDWLSQAVHHGLLLVEGETTRGDGEITTTYRFVAAHVFAALRSADEIGPPRTLPMPAP